MSSKKPAKETIEWAVNRGWTYEGTDGSSHHVIRWKGGETYRIPGTPSDHRSTKNTRAGIARIDGKPVEHIKRGKVRHQRQVGFTSTRPVADEHAERRTELLDELADCEAELLKRDPRIEADTVVNLASRAMRIMHSLLSCGYVNSSEIPLRFQGTWNDITQERIS